MAESRVRRSVWTAKRECDICGAGRFEALGRRRKPMPSRAGTFEFDLSDALCKSCGFVFAARTPKPEFLNAYYGGGFTRDSAFGVIDPAFDSRKRLRLIRKHVPAGASIVEIGANTGEFCKFLGQNGYRAQGVDPILDRSSAGLRRGFISGGDGASRGKKFDAAVSYYVLEHVTDARAWLTRIASGLNERAWMVIEVPNFLTHPAESLNLEHLSHFSPEHLSRLLGSIGFETVQIDRKDASRYFGFAIVARRSAWAVQKSASPKLALAMRRAYARALAAETARKQRIGSLAGKVLHKLRKEKRAELFVWAANDIASEFGRALASRGFRSAQPVDGARQKIGRAHEGFSRRVEPPVFAPGAESKRFFVLCSPSWNAQIRGRLVEMKLKNIAVADAAAVWQKGMREAR